MVCTDWYDIALQYTDWNIPQSVNDCKILATTSRYVYYLVIHVAVRLVLQYYCMDLEYFCTYIQWCRCVDSTCVEASSMFLLTSSVPLCTPIPLTLPGGCHHLHYFLQCQDMYKVLIFSKTKHFMFYWTAVFSLVPEGSYRDIGP